MYQARQSARANLIRVNKSAKRLCRRFHAFYLWGQFAGEFNSRQQKRETSLQTFSHAGLRLRMRLIRRRLAFSLPRFPNACRTHLPSKLRPMTHDAMTRKCLTSSAKRGIV